jgi:superfamily II DNA or RNA helicase
LCDNWTCLFYEKLIAGLKAECLSSKNSSERDRIREQFKKKEFNYLFVVDIFWRCDIPEIDTVLFKTNRKFNGFFLQQLGRGLRLSEEKIV